MKRLILHVGTQKTGTTSLQVFLADNRKQLGEQGFFVPGTREKYKEAINERNAHFLVWHSRSINVPELVTDEVKRKTKRNIKAFKKSVRDHDAVLMSDETLWYEGARRPNSWSIMKSVFQDAGFDEIDIVVYLRRQDDYICSLWNQRVKGSLKSTVSCVDFVNGRTSKRLMDYSEVLSEIEKVFGKEHITVREYRRDKLAGGDVRRDFCSIIGVDAESGFTFADVRPNLGLTSNIAEIKRAANSSEVYQAGPNFLRASAQNVSVSTSGNDARSLLPPDLRQEILDRYAEGNERIAREYLGREDGKLFDMPESLPEEWELDPDDFSRDMIRFFTDALATEHGRWLVSEKHVKALSRRVTALEKQTEALEMQTEALEKQTKALEKKAGIQRPSTGKSSEKECILTRVYRKIRKELKNRKK